MVKMRLTVIDKSGAKYSYDTNKEKCPLEARDIMAKRTDIPIQNFVLASKDGLLYNPLDIHDNINKKDKMRGSYFYSLLRCNAACYDTYVTYLQYMNKRHLILAQRRFGDGP